MPESYYVHKQAQSNGDHEVHVYSCRYLPLSQNRIFVGDFNTCNEALLAASRHFSHVDGCLFCSPACHYH